MAGWYQVVKAGAMLQRLPLGRSRVNRLISATTKMHAHRSPMQEWDERIRGWARDAERIRRRVGDGRSGVRRSIASVGQRLIEFRFGNRLGIAGVESAGLIELEDARPRFARCPGQTSRRTS